MLRRDDLVVPSRALLREGPLTKLRRGAWGSSAPHSSRRHAYLFSDIFVLHANEAAHGDERAPAPVGSSKGAARARVLPLPPLIIITHDTVRCPSLEGRKSFSYEASPLDPQSGALHPAIAAILKTDPRNLEAELANLIVVAAPGAGSQRFPCPRTLILALAFALSLTLALARSLQARAISCS